MNETLNQYLNENKERVIEVAAPNIMEMAAKEIVDASVGAVSKFVTEVRARRDEWEKEYHIVVPHPFYSDTFVSAVLEVIGGLQGSGSHGDNFTMLSDADQERARMYAEKQLIKQAMIWMGMDPNTIPYRGV